MGRAVLLACLPWLALLIVLGVCLLLVMRVNRARFRWGRLLKLHRDQTGAVQGLSFVLTLPFFIMVVLLVVQVSQLMIGTIVVHYAAFAAARSAVVWSPAHLDFPVVEPENCINWRYVDPEAPDQVFPILDPTDPNYGPAEGGLTFVVAPDSPKYSKIKSAAVLACMPICPSRDLGQSVPSEARTASAILKSLYRSMAPGSAQNTRIPRRLENKLAYAMRATEIEIRFFHSNQLPPLVSYPRLDDVPDDLTVEYMGHEMGWQDPITVKVKHWMALLPGPGRLLARMVRRRDGSPDRTAETIQRTGGVYVYPLEASVTLSNEGQKSVRAYVHYLY